MKLFEGNPIGRRNAGLSAVTSRGKAILDALTYQMGGTAVVGGVPQAQWTGTVYFTGSSGGVPQRTAISPGVAMMHPSTITHLSVSTDTDTVPGKVILARWNGATWNVLAAQSITLVKGTVEVDLSPAWRVRDGDVLGAVVDAVTDRVLVVQVSPLPSAWRDHEAVGDNVTFGLIMENELCIEAVGYRPYLGLASDSIYSGTSEWWLPEDAGAPTSVTVPGGNPDYALARMFGRVNAVNRSKGSQTWAYGVSTAWANLMESDPHTVVMGYGVNDLVTGRTWAQVEGNLDSIKTLWESSGVQRLCITETLPRTAGDDVEAATLRAWNENLAVWCAANDVMLIATHDAVGQVRASTGELDDLKAGYNHGDNIHLNAAGMAVLGATIRAALGL